MLVTARSKEDENDNSSNTFFTKTKRTMEGGPEEVLEVDEVIVK